jgi:hypothetical protein
MNKLMDLYYLYGMWGCSFEERANRSYCDVNNEGVYDLNGRFIPRILRRARPRNIPLYDPECVENRRRYLTQLGEPRFVWTDWVDYSAEQYRL